MLKKAGLCLSFLFFVFSLSPGPRDRFSADSGALPQSSFSADHRGAFPDINQISVRPNRLLRGKDSMKSWHIRNIGIQELSPVHWTAGAFPPVHLSKSGVYQRINVYRL
jgi:hypothetical protein